MRAYASLMAVLALGACLAPVSPALAQGSGVSDPECQRLRERLAEHARLSDGVRREATTLPAPSPAALPAPAAAPAPVSDASRLRCQELPAAVDNAVKIRRRELGAREDQAGVIPLARLRGQTPEQIGQELAGQFPSGPAASTQVGLRDAESDGRLDGVVDVPAPGVFRLVRQRADGTVGVEVFPAPGSAEFQNLRGETARMLEIISPVDGGVSMRRVVVLARSRDQELLEEVTTIVRPVAYWRTDVEVDRRRETRRSSGVPTGTPAISAPRTFTLER